MIKHLWVKFGPEGHHYETYTAEKNYPRPYDVVSIIETLTRFSIEYQGGSSKVYNKDNLIAWEVK